MEDIQHGGNLLQAIDEFGGVQEDWLDLSTGVSPFTIKLPEFHQDVWRRLPEPGYVLVLEDKAKVFYQTKADCLIVPGSQFSIQCLSMILNDDVGILEPTYGEYAAWFVHHNRSFISLADITDIGNASSVILANPNNPDGRLYARQELLELAAQLSERGGYLVVDEAFMPMDDGNSLLGALNRASNIIILRSIGKFFGLAGIRLGLVFCCAEIRRRLAAFLGLWAVTGPTLAIADHIFTHRYIADEISQKISIRHKRMREMLWQSGLTILGQNDLFFLIQHANAKGLHISLKRMRILTRIFDYNSGWMRLGLTVNSSEDARLLDALIWFEK